MNHSTTSVTARRTENSLDAVFDVLACETRRATLGLLSEHGPSPIVPDELARRVVAWRLDTQVTAVPTDEVDRVASELHHVQVPKLAAAGFIDRTDRGALVLDDRHPALRDPTVRAMIDPILPAGSASELDALFRALADARRRSVLHVLSTQSHPIRRGTLAAAVVARDEGGPERAPPQEAADRFRVALDHVHLPVLRAAGLVSVDEARETVRYEGHPRLPARWLRSHLGPVEDLLADDRRTDIATLSDRENIVTYGQSLCERADNELFVLVTSSELLDRGCLARIRDAADRGVTVYLGSPDPTVREWVLERAPAVVSWTPRSDWLDLRPDGDRVGRLVFADRAAVMIAMFERRSDGPVREETAIVGEGPTNGLVAIVDRLLDAHHGRPDEPSEDVRSELPF